MLETPAGSYPTAGGSRRLERRKQCSLLILRSDGSRVLRLKLSGRLSLAVLAATVLGVGALSTLAGDWWPARIRIRESPALLREVDAQRATLAGINRRLSELQQEIEGWRELHA